MGKDLEVSSPNWIKSEYIETRRKEFFYWQIYFTEFSAAGSVVSQVANEFIVHDPEKTNTKASFLSNTKNHSNLFEVHVSPENLQSPPTIARTLPKIAEDYRSSPEACRRQENTFNSIQLNFYFYNFEFYILESFREYC